MKSTFFRSPKAAHSKRTTFSVNMGRGHGYLSNGGQQENLDQNVARDVRKSFYPARGVFHDLTIKLAARMNKDEPSRKGSSLKQSSSEDTVVMSFQGSSSRVPRNRTQPDKINDLYTTIEASTSDSARNFRQIHSPAIRSPACQLTITRSRPQGPRAAPGQSKLTLEKDYREFCNNKQLRDTPNLPQSALDPQASGKAASCSGGAVQRKEPVISARYRSSYTDCNNTRLHSQKAPAASNVMSTDSETRSRSPHREIESERLGIPCRDKDPGLDIDRDMSSSAAGNIGNVDAAASKSPRRDFILTRTILQWLTSIKTIFSGADEKLQKLAILSEFGIWQRVIEMVLHVFQTLHHASPALQVLRSTNARAGEYGKALKDFSRAIVYLLVLLSLLQLVTQTVRIILLILAALAWPFRMVWVVSRWVTVG